MNSTSQTQSSQSSRTHENFCTQFCSQVDRYTAAGEPQTNEKYMQQIKKIVSQLSEERRWSNFTNFVKLQCEKDGGELFSKFVKCWFIALGHIGADKDHILPMVLLVMEALKAENLSLEAVVAFDNVLEKQMMKMNGRDIKAFGDHVSENFRSGRTLAKRWLSATARFLRSVVNLKEKCIQLDSKNVNGTEYRNVFLLEVLEDVISSISFKDLVGLLRECLLHEILISFVENLLQKEPMPETCLKLIIILPEVLNWKGEQVCAHLLAKADFPFEDLYTLSFELHEMFGSSAAIPKLFFSRLKHHRQLVSNSRFALICLLSLCNTARFHTISAAELKQNVVKLQKHSDRLRGSAWIRDVMDDCDVEALKNNLDAVIGATIVDTKWSAIIGNTLQEVAFMLLLDKSNSDLKLSDGRIVGDAGVSSMGKSILVSVAGVNPEAIGQLIEKIFRALSRCSKQNSALILIDTIVEIVLRHTVHVLNAWKSLQSWLDSICDLKEGIGIAVVRALLPVIVLRPQLITIMLNVMKKHVLCDRTVATALPILLLLLRSSTMRSAVKSDFYSQSFATFSTQALQNMGVDTKNTNVELSLEIIGILKRTFSQPASVKSLLYRGIIEAACANQNLVHPTLDLLLTHLVTLHQISRPAYVESSKSSTVLLEPLPDLVQAVSILVRMSIYGLRNTSTQIVSSKDAQVAKAMSEIDKLIEFVIDKDMQDLELDKLSDFSLSTAGRTNLCFASMIIALYDVLIEHLWHVGQVLTRKNAADKLLGVLRKREELSEVLKEKMAKRKESKGEKVPITFSNTAPKLQSISSLVSRFVQRTNDGDIDVDDECLQMLRENAFTWAMDWAKKISVDIYKFDTHARFSALAAFSRAMLLLYVGGKLVHESAAFDLWNHKCTQAVVAFSNVISSMISKYGDRCEDALLEMLYESKEDQRELEKDAAVPSMIRFILSDLLPKLLEAHKDFEERKMASDFTHQASALITACRALFKQSQLSNEKVQVICAKLVRNILQKLELADKTVLKEIWQFYVYIERAGKCGTRYTSFLRDVAAQILTALDDEKRETGQSLASINEITVETTAEMVAAACSASLLDARLLVEMMSQVIMPSVDAGLVKMLDLCGRIADIIRILLPVHINYAVAKESICAALRALYEALNVTVKLLLKKHKCEDISEWTALTKLAALAHGSVLRIMESADENVGTLNPLDEPALTHNRKMSKSQKDETLYVTYVRSRELYQANMLLLCSALHDDRLDIQVRNNSIGVRDFRIDVEKLRQRMEEIGEEEGSEGEDRTQTEQQQPPKKRLRVGNGGISKT